MTDDDIDLSNIPETTPEQWARAVPNPYYRPSWETVRTQRDRYVLDWFHSHHGDDPTTINTALMDHFLRVRAAKAGE